MMPWAEVRVLDANAEALGVPVATLMENAGKALAEEALVMGGKRVLVLAGPGNNGGDGAVMARHLAKQRKVTLALARPRKDLANPLLLANLKRLPKAVQVVAAPTEAKLRALLEQADLVVDALLGAGLEGAPREPIATWVRLANASRKPVLSVDVPTGLGSPLAIKPQVTVALHDAKEGTTPEVAGRIVVRSIGIPEQAWTHTGPGELALYPIPKPTQHKGQGGVVLVVGGGPYTGAPALTAMAALRAGADLAVVLTPARAADVIASYDPNLIVRPLNGYDVDLTHPDNLAVVEEFLPRATAVCIGNGMGRDERALESVHRLLDRVANDQLPVVVDGDGLHALAQERDKLRRGIVLTPHAGEFQALTGEALASEDDAPEQRLAQVQRWARELGCTLVAKGHRTIVTDGQRTKRNSTGNPGLSHGGTGDTLAGIVSALLGKGLDPFDAARLGAWMGGRAGDIAFEEKRFGLLATDVIEAIPAVFREAGLHWREGPR
jgi:ADP-dependent NAD(P)H-hydrate dehydratase / NAD(P)H-hydrate epimerase